VTAILAGIAGDYIDRPCPSVAPRDRAFSGLDEVEPTGENWRSNDQRTLKIAAATMFVFITRPPRHRLPVNVFKIEKTHDFRGRMQSSC